MIQDVPPLQDHGQAIHSFFGLHLWAILLVPLALLLALAWFRGRKQKRRVREVTDSGFAEEVLANPLPVLVHFYRSWGIADQVVMAQVETLAAENAGRLDVVWMDLDHSPHAVTRLHPLESPAVVLFRDGERIYQRGGVFQAADLQKDLDRLLRFSGPAEQNHGPGREVEGSPTRAKTRNQRDPWPT
jgi:thioredoxin 1